VINTNLAERAPWVLKDPRMCLTAPLWMDALEQPLCIIGYKNPREVRGSLYSAVGDASCAIVHPRSAAQS
jgi:hypothetical protein